MPNTEPIYSSLAADAALAEIVTIFVDEMPGRVAGLVATATARDWETLRRTAHQMKGACGSYGFSSLTEAARDLETAIRQRLPEEDILLSLEQLIGVCQRAQAGTPDRLPQLNG